jgi:hypothetical protein
MLDARQIYELDPRSSTLSLKKPEEKKVFYNFPVVRKTCPDVRNGNNGGEHLGTHQEEDSSRSRSQARDQCYKTFYGHNL